MTVKEWKRMHQSKKARKEKRQNRSSTLTARRWIFLLSLCATCSLLGNVALLWQLEQNQMESKNHGGLSIFFHKSKMMIENEASAAVSNNQRPSSSMPKRDLKEELHSVNPREEEEEEAHSNSAGQHDNNNNIGEIPMWPKKLHNQDDSRHDQETINSSVAGLDCSKFGGPSNEAAAEMVYWRDIPRDATSTSPFSNFSHEQLKYLTFEPDVAGWNNQRMGLETAVVMALAMGRILVMPPTFDIWNLKSEQNETRNKFTFYDFFPFDLIEKEYAGLHIISMEEFIKREALAGQLIDVTTGSVSFPYNNFTTWDGDVLGDGINSWRWLRNVATTPTWSSDDCVLVFPEKPGKQATMEIKKYSKAMQSESSWDSNVYIGNPTPVDADPYLRLKETLGQRRKICLYGDYFQKRKVLHFTGHMETGSRLLAHFYGFLFFQNWHQDLWVKRFVRDHLRYVDELQCGAAKIVRAVRNEAKQNGDPTGTFDTFHLRRGDFIQWVKDTTLDAQPIYDRVHEKLVENSTIYIASDEANMTYFEPLRKHYHIYFLQDFLHLIPHINKNFHGTVEQLVASRGRTFVGTYFSTFTGYINRLRGYHSQKDKAPGYQEGAINSYFWTPEEEKNRMRTYFGVTTPLYKTEFPTGWRGLDRDVILSNLDKNSEVLDGMPT